MRVNKEDFKKNESQLKLNTCLEFVFAYLH